MQGAFPNVKATGQYNAVKRRNVIRRYHPCNADRAAQRAVLYSSTYVMYLPVQAISSQATP